MTTRILAPSVLRLVVGVLLVAATSSPPMWSFALWFVWIGSLLGLAWLIVPDNRRWVILVTFLLTRVVPIPLPPLLKYRPPSAVASDSSAVAVPPVPPAMAVDGGCIINTNGGKKWVPVPCPPRPAAPRWSYDTSVAGGPFADPGPIDSTASTRTSARR